MNSIGDFNYKADVLMEKLRKKANGKEKVTIFNEFNNLTLDIINHVSCPNGEIQLFEPILTTCELVGIYFSVYLNGLKIN